LPNLCEVLTNSKKGERATIHQGYYLLGKKI